MESLADYLGVNTADNTPQEGARETYTAEQFCRHVLESFEFRTFILNGLRLGSLPAAIVNRIIDQGWGKVPDKLEHTVTTNALESMTVEELEERALFLAQAARALRSESSKAVH